MQPRIKTRIADAGPAGRRTATAAPRHVRRRVRRRVRVACSVLGVVALLALLPTVPAASCDVPGKNVQCNDFGTIAMDNREEIRGKAIPLTATIVLATDFQDQGARWLMFSLRNVTSDGGSPVTIRLLDFATASDDVVTTRIEQPSAHELNLWVDVLDTPVGTPITLRASVGAIDRGAFSVEALVMAFDRGYEPVKDAQGRDMSLFSFTLVGVNEETGSASGGASILDRHNVPGLGVAAATAVLAVALVAARRRSS